MTDAEFGARHFRGVLDRVMVVARVACLLAGDEQVAADHLLRARAAGGHAGDDAGYADRVDELAAAPA